MIGPEITAHVDRLRYDIEYLIQKFNLRCSSWSESVEVVDIKFTPIETHESGMKTGPKVEIKIDIKGKTR